MKDIKGRIVCPPLSKKLSSIIGQVAQHKTQRFVSSKAFQEHALHSIGISILSLRADCGKYISPHKFDKSS